MLLFLFIALSCLAIALMYFLAFKAAYRSHSPLRPLFLYSLIVSSIVTSGYLAWGYHDICTSKSSTAAIGLLFLPFFAVAVAVAGFLFSLSGLYVARFVIERLGLVSDRITSAVPLVLAVVLLILIGYAASGKVARHKLLNAAASGTNADSLAKILDDGILNYDLEVLSELAKNPNTPGSDLVRIFDCCKHSVTEFNPPEIPAFITLAQNPQTPPRILVVLAGCQQSAIRYAVAINPNTPTKTLRQLAEDQDDLVKKYAKPKLRVREDREKSQ